MILKSVITCPECGHKKEEEMPENNCQFFYKCESCQAIINAKHGDCCVYCSYGDTPCPPAQIAGASCCGGD